jgi:hypothetical protein
MWPESGIAIADNVLAMLAGEPACEWRLIAKTMLGAMVADGEITGEIIEVPVEGWRAMHYTLGSDTEVLRHVSAGRVP